MGLYEVSTRHKLCPMATSKLEEMVYKFPLGVLGRGGLVACLETAPDHEIDWLSSQLEIIQLTEDFELAIPVIVGVLDTMW